MRCWAMPVLVFGARLVARLPQRGLLGIANALATLLAPLLARRRRIAARNLQACFPALDAKGKRQSSKRYLRRTNRWPKT